MAINSLQPSIEKDPQDPPKSGRTPLWQGAVCFIGPAPDAHKQVSTPVPLCLLIAIRSISFHAQVSIPPVPVLCCAWLLYLHVFLIPPNLWSCYCYYYCTSIVDLFHFHIDMALGPSLPLCCWHRS